MDFDLPFGKPFWQPVKGKWDMFLIGVNFVTSLGFLIMWKAGLTRNEKPRRRNPQSGIEVLGSLCVVGFNGIVFKLTRALDFSELGKNWLSFPVYWAQGTSPKVSYPDEVGLEPKASYDSIGTEVSDSVDNRQKILDALELARSWGWSHAFSKSDRIITGEFVSWLDRLASNIKIAGMAIPGGIFPLPRVSVGIGPRSITKGGPIRWGDRIALSPEYVADSDTTNENLAFALVHEALHHIMYRYELDLYDHHLATAMASIMNAMCLYKKTEQLAIPRRWPGYFGYNVGLLEGFNQKNIAVSPNLPVYSVVPVTQTFSQKLDEIADIISTWGVGGWIDEFKPSLNYVGSGVGLTGPHEIILNLNAPSVENAWLVASVTMEIMADEWAEALKQQNPLPELANELSIIGGKLRAWWLGMFALTIRIGINKGN